MSKVETLRAFVNERLTAAAEEIFELFERTIAEELESTLKDNQRQQKLLDALLNPEVRLHRTGLSSVIVFQTWEVTKYIYSSTILRYL